MSIRVQQPLISFITVSYNSATQIEQTIASVASCKELFPCEYIVVDGGSTDGTDMLLANSTSWIDQAIIEPDGGIYDAMNKGISIATGEYICFVNSDDRIIPRGAFKVAGLLKSSRQRVDVVASAAIATDKMTETLWLATKPDRFLVFRCPNLCHNGVYAHRSVFDRVGGFDTNLRIAADSDWIVRAYRSGSHFQVTSTPTVFYALGGTSSDVRLHADEMLFVAHKAYPKLRDEVIRSLFIYLYAWEERKRHFGAEASLSFREALREASHFYPELSYLRYLVNDRSRQVAMTAYSHIRHALGFGAA